MIKEVDEHWDLEIKPQNHLFELHLVDVWRYRDLLGLLVRRDFVSFYKQTVLGPLWFFIQRSIIHADRETVQVRFGLCRVFRLWRLTQWLIAIPTSGEVDLAGGGLAPKMSVSDYEWKC